MTPLLDGKSWIKFDLNCTFFFGKMSVKIVKGLGWLILHLRRSYISAVLARRSGNGIVYNRAAAQWESDFSSSELLAQGLSS